MLFEEAIEKFTYALIAWIASIMIFSMVILNIIDYDKNFGDTPPSLLIFIFSFVVAAFLLFIYLVWLVRAVLKKYRNKSKRK